MSKRSCESSEELHRSDFANGAGEQLNLYRRIKEEDKKMDLLSMKEAVAKYIEGCKGKAAMPVHKMLIRAFLAGMMIAFGAGGSSVAAHAISDVGLARLTAGVVFPVGLMMVILSGAELFTGDCMVIIGATDGKISYANVLKILVLVWLGNFVGGGLTALAFSLSGQYNYSAGLLGAYTIKVALGKVSLSFGTALVSGILCNVLVCAAVIMALCAKDVTGKLWVSFFLIMLFVVCGFEHCVANMYYITAGLLAKANPTYVQVAMEQYGYTAEQLASLNVGNFLVKNLLPVTIGNIIGGMAVVGLPLWYINKEKE